MENRTFEPDYSGIKRRVIIRLIVEFVVMIIHVPLSLWIYSADIYGEHQTLDDLLLVMSGILLAHLIMSVIFSIRGFTKCIRTATLSEAGLKVNSFEYKTIIRPDDMRGAGLNFTTGIMQLLVPCMGQDLVVIASDDSGKQIRRFFWTGPVSDKDAKNLRKDFLSFLSEGIKLINDQRYDLVRDMIRTDPVTVKIDKNKFKKDTVKYSVIIGGLAVILLAGAVMNIKTLALAVILTAGAGFVVAYWVSIIMKTRSNIGDLITELKLTDKTLSANGDIYDLAELDVDLMCIGDPGQNTQSSIRFEAPKTKFESGIYLTLSDPSKSNKYWIGPQIDSEAAGAIILSRYAKKVAEELSENT